MNIEMIDFGLTSDNMHVKKYTIYNDMGSSVSILNYGGIITNIMVPDKNNNIENVVLSFDTIKEYEEKSPHFGCIVGRIAGRISNASFKIDNNVYTLAKNNNKNSIHGGLKGFDKVIWDVTQITEKDKASLSLYYFSEDGEEGFPGNLHVNVTYTFNNNNDLEIQYSAKTDKKTIVNLTNHSYFNLSSGERNILEQYLQINADSYGLVDTETIPYGVENVENTPFDFRTMKLVGQDIKSNNKQLNNALGYDHPYFINDNDNVSAIMYDKESGRYMEVITDQKAVIFYAGNQLEEGIKLSSGIINKKHMGLCLETQYYPDAINQDCFETRILTPEDTYTAYTKYSFKVK
ncbi:MAG: galactose mutarotase [Vallitalea sp.]|jgi:aldose 1-epimerase|nr:galactose mutarotase [Vallitalea sp.]